MRMRWQIVEKSAPVYVTNHSELERRCADIVRCGVGVIGFKLGVVASAAAEESVDEARPASETRLVRQPGTGGVRKRLVGSENITLAPIEYLNGYAIT